MTKHGKSPITETGRFSRLKMGQMFHTGGTLRYTQNKTDRRKRQKQMRDLERKYQGE